MSLRSLWRTLVYHYHPTEVDDTSTPTTAFDRDKLTAMSMRDRLKRELNAVLIADLDYVLGPTCSERAAKRKHPRP